MPIYEYLCASCSTVVERLRKYRERELPLPCPSCGRATRAVMSVAAVLGSASGELPIKQRCNAGPACCGGACRPD